jgi:hypothetical protein
VRSSDATEPYAQEPISAATLVLRTAALSLPVVGGVAQLDIVAILQHLSYLAERDPAQAALLVKRCRLLAPSVVADSDRVAFVAKQATKDGYTVERYTDMLQAIVEEPVMAPCAVLLAGGGELLELLVRMDQNCFDGGPSHRP